MRIFPLHRRQRVVSDYSDPELRDFRGSLRDAEGTRRYGHRWSASQSSLAIHVPSVIIPIEYNVLLNPLHAIFQSVIWNAPQEFEFDSRLLWRTGTIL